MWKEAVKALSVADIRVKELKKTSQILSELLVSEKFPTGSGNSDQNPDVRSYLIVRYLTSTVDTRD
jgi:hypothetical protein